MQCEFCQAELDPAALSCSECGAPIRQTVPGFENTQEIQRILHTLIVENFSVKPVNARSLIALLKDYLVDYIPEQRLLIYTINSGVLRSMLGEGDRNIAVMRARTCLLGECFVSREAAEFVLACLTYMMKWEYKIELSDEEPVREASPAPSDKKENKGPVAIDEKVLRPVDAIRFRISRHVVIQKNYTQIDGYAFDKFTVMRTVKLPPTIVAIGEYAFSGCKSLQNIEIPDSVRVIRQGAFSQCSELTGIRIPKGVLEIEDNTFFYCASLVSAEIPTTVSSIGMHAFSGCDKLKKLTLPDSVKYIDANAFLYCPELTIRCYENSYAHKYCLSHNIKADTVPVGMDLNTTTLD